MIASPSPSTRSIVCGSFSRAAVFISSKLCMVTIFGARFVPAFDMNREYRGMRTRYILVIRYHVRLALISTNRSKVLF